MTKQRILKLTRDQAEVLYRGYVSKRLEQPVCDIEDKDCFEASFLIWCRDNEIELEG